MEAHALPFAHGFFDALVSIDAYHYLGTDDLYLSAVRRLVRPGGPMAIAVPGLSEELEDGPQRTCGRPGTTTGGPATARAGGAGPCAVEVADLIPDGWRLWADGDAMRGEHDLPSLYGRPRGGAA